jgi:hypothetical protein
MPKFIKILDGDELMKLKILMNFYSLDIYYNLTKTSANNFKNFYKFLSQLFCKDKRLNLF